jgi:hypothetical protein
MKRNRCANERYYDLSAFLAQYNCLDLKRGSPSPVTGIRLITTY